MKRKEATFLAVQALVVVGVLALVSLPLQSTNESGHTSSSATSPPSSQVIPSIDEWIGSLNQGNSTQFAQFYGNSSVLRWTGNLTGSFIGTPFQGGAYVGASQIKKVYFSILVCRPSPTAFQISNITLTETSPQGTNATFSLVLDCNAVLYGATNADVVVTQRWVPQDGGSSWLISAETWDFLNWSVQFSFSA